MASTRFAPGQLDLFAKPANRKRPEWLDPDHTDLEDPEEPTDLERVRERLHRMLEQARAATDKLPWGFTESLGVEATFRSECGWLPAREAYELRCAFAAEMARLYDAIDEFYPYEAYPPIPPE